MQEFEIRHFQQPEGEIALEAGHVFSYPLHMHAYYEMTLYDSFPGQVTVNERIVDMRTPAVILIAPSDMHRIDASVNAQARYRKISFTHDVFSHGAPLDSSLVLTGVDQDGFLFRLFQEIFENSERKEYKRALVQAAVACLMESAQRILPAAASGSRHLAIQAVRILNERFFEPITLSSVAHSLSVSPQYLSMVFKAGTGMNFSHFLGDVRLRWAAHLLQETKESITEICARCGYQNFSHFLRSFKKRFGVSPAAYRRQKAGEEKKISQ